MVPRKELREDFYTEDNPTITTPNTTIFLTPPTA